MPQQPARDPSPALGLPGVYAPKCGAVAPSYATHHTTTTQRYSMPMEEDGLGGASAALLALAPWRLLPESVPDAAWDIVLGHLYSNAPITSQPGSGLCSLTALSMASRALRDMVCRTRERARYHLTPAADCGRACAAHINSLAACSSLCVHTGPEPHMGLVAFLCNVSSSAASHVHELLVRPDHSVDSIEAASVLLLARVMPSLHTVKVRPCLRDGRELLLGLAPCCPGLTHLEARVPTFRAEHVQGISGLRDLSSLGLSERLANSGSDAAAVGATAGLLQQLQLLAELTHLRLGFGAYPCDLLSAALASAGAGATAAVAAAGAASPGALQPTPTLTLPPIRHLQLLGNCRVSGRDFRAVAAALPSLEVLHIGSFEDSPGATADLLLQPADWRHPNLTTIRVDHGDDAEDEAHLSLEAALAISNGCPKLTQIEQVNLYSELREQDNAEAAAGELRACARGLAALRRRRLLRSVEVVVCTHLAARTLADAAAAAAAMVAGSPASGGSGAASCGLPLLPPDEWTAVSECVDQLDVEPAVSEQQLAALVHNLPKLQEVSLSSPEAVTALAALPQLAVLHLVAPPGGSAEGSSFGDASPVSHVLPALLHLAWQRMCAGAAGGVNVAPGRGARALKVRVSSRWLMPGKELLSAAAQLAEQGVQLVRMSFGREYDV